MSLIDSALSSSDELESPSQEISEAPVPQESTALPLRITGCILARNEEGRIAAALESLALFCDQVIVLDNESRDRTADIAREHGALVIPVPLAETGSNFDAVRNKAIEHATGDWIFYLDADERVPSRLGSILKQLLADGGDAFEAVLLPFQHHFCGKWMQNALWWPGYTRPQLLKKGRFRYNERLHGGVDVSGKTIRFPADDPQLALVHHSYDNLHHYLDKLNRYTDGEAENLLQDGASHDWEAQLAHFVHDWQMYYENGKAGERDGMHGFVLSFLSAFYRFASRAKLWDLRRGRGGADPEEPVPGSIREMLLFMARVAEEGAAPWLNRPAPLPPVPPVPEDAPRLPLVWSAPLLDASGYADEARAFVLALVEAGEPIAVAPLNWGNEDPGLPETVAACIKERETSASTPAEVFVSMTTPPLNRPSPAARVNVARTMFETDRLRPGWEQALNAFDRVWVPSEFNRDTFVRSGVAPDKIAVVPGAIDAHAYESVSEREPWPTVPGRENAFRFLSVFDWTLHKGWDVLLTAFAGEFAGEFAGDENDENVEPVEVAPVELVLKVWSSNHYRLEDIRAQADAHLARTFGGRTLADFPNIHLWQERVPSDEMPRVYRAADAYVTPTRGEGWCRPLMEAMAAGLPTIATGWSGLTAFHSARVGFPVKYRLEPVSEAGAREIPIYEGHYWAEPDIADLRRRMRAVVTDRVTAGKKGEVGRAHILKHFRREAVAKQVQAELAHCRALAAEKAAARAVPAGPTGPAGALPKHRPAAPPQRPSANPVPLDPIDAVDLTSGLGRSLRVCWEGDQDILSSLALVNQEFCLRLLERKDVRLSFGAAAPPGDETRAALVTGDPRLESLFRALESAKSSGDEEGADVTIRHFFPPNWTRPRNGGKLVLLQPWEWGHLPEDWAQAAAKEADEVWAYSRFVRDVYVRSGVPAEKVRVVPLGVRSDVFTPEGPHYPLATSKTVRFLFVGGTIHRKGADLLLAAYRRAFTRNEDVCLVVKDMGTDTYYRGQNLAGTLRAAQADASGPEVLYLGSEAEQTMPAETLASLYRSCTSVVLPYRGEGFALSPLEGMACGRVPIVTAGGPTEDYLDDTMALRVPSRVRLSGSDRVGHFRCVGDPWGLEADVDALAAALRWVYENPEQAATRGQAARAHVESGWNWERSVAVACERLADLAAASRAAEHSFGEAVAWAPESLEVSAENRAEAMPPVPAPVSVEADDVEADDAGATGPATSRSKWRGSRKETGKPADDPVIEPMVEPVIEPVIEPVGLSLCMIARDEEARIGKCLESIRPFVDEMIVVDTGSKDNTREIAASLGAKVFDFPWTDSFAEARNQSLQKASGKWIFWMDADDVISPECGKALKEICQRHPDQMAAYQVQVRIPPGAGEFSETLVDHVKLFPNRPDLRFEHRIHEQILPSLRQAGIPVLFSDLYVTHQHYDRSPEGQKKKRLRDFRLLEKDLLNHPDHPFVLFNLGMTHLYATKEFEVAAHFLRRSLQASHPRDSIVRKAYGLLTTARICQGEWEQALRANEEGRRHYADDAELLYQAGQIYQHVGRMSEARAALERLVQGQDDAHYRSVDVGLRTYKGFHELALLFARMGDVPHAVAVLREIAARYPQYLPAQEDLLTFLNEK